MTLLIDPHGILPVQELYPVGCDGIRRGKNIDLLNADEVKIDKANELVYWKMSTDREFVTYLNEVKAEILHSKGWSKDKTLKARYEIPSEAFFALPPEVRENRKNLARWVKEYHPYLDLTK